VNLFACQNEHTIHYDGDHGVERLWVTCGDTTLAEKTWGESSADLTSEFRYFIRRVMGEHERDAAAAEVARLRRVVERYAQHDDDCAVRLGYADGSPRSLSSTPGDWDCDCGCDEATYMAAGVVPWKEVQSAEVAELRSRINQVRAAIANPGPKPDYHMRTMAKHNREWPTLWKALDRLIRPGVGL
jgi:hypothetical protein